MRHFFRRFVGLGIIFLTGACATPATVQTQLAPGSLDNQQKIGIVWLSRCSIFNCVEEIATNGYFWPQGTAGQLYHYGVVASYTGVFDAATALDVSDIVNELYLEKLKASIEFAGMTAVVKSDPFFPPKLKTLKKPKSVKLETLIKGNRSVESMTLYPKMSREAEYDFSEIAAEMGVQLLLALQVLEFGAQRDFGPFAIPMSVTYGVAAVRGTLTDTANGKTLLSDYAYYEIKPDGENTELEKISRVLDKSNAAMRSAINDVTANLSKAFQ